MLQIKDIRKQYITGELVQTALDGVSLNLRDNEFVAILGPSGSGKTTLLNVIGGLDRYDSGDLIINGISTKKYSDRDWDSYRNHTIGFVFQSYNLIPHQSVLANVELALTISGISPSERKKRAKAALESVGLGNQLHKKPNQMSGGQMQRVAIARALVNNPDILLADEPTGALDSETSVQIMDLLKEVAKDRLVVMVTHNPELAEEYANRIVRVKDGKIIGDTNPFEVDTSLMAAPKHKNMGRSSMSWFTALSLSFNNLRTKLARTLLTSFAGSIGIIGIALIMSLSTGFQKYIDKIQADTLSNYPLTLQSEKTDVGAALAAFGSSMMEISELPEGVVGEQQMITAMFSQVGKNDLGSFKSYLEENFDQISHAVSAVRYSYSVRPQIFASDPENLLQVNPAKLFGKVTGSAAMSAYMDSNVFYEMINNVELLESQYEVVLGRWPEHYSEMVFVLTDPNSITDYMAYALGMKDADGLQEMIQKVMQGEEAVLESEPGRWTYEDLMNLRFKLVDATALYRYNEEYAVWEDMSDSKEHMRSLIENGEELSIVGIVCPREGATATLLSSGIAYTEALTHHVIEKAESSRLVSDQLKNPAIDVFTGKEFGAKDEEEQLSFEDMISIDGDAIASSFGMNISTDRIMSMLTDYLSDAMQDIDVDTQAAQQDFLDTLRTMGNEMLLQFVEENADESGKAKLSVEDGPGMVEAYLAGAGAAHIQALADKYPVTAEEFTQVYSPLLEALVNNCVASSLSLSAASPVDETTAPAETTEPEITEPVTTEPETTEPETTEPETTEPETTEPEETEPEETEPEATEVPGESEPSEPDVTEPEATEPEVTVPPVDIPEIDTTVYAQISAAMVPGMVDGYMVNTVVTGTAAAMGSRMMSNEIAAILMQKVSGFGNLLTGYIGGSFYVNEEKLASAFQFNMTEEDLRRLMEAMSTQDQQTSAEGNLRTLGYADMTQPNSISIYMGDFEKKEEFIAFLDAYNDMMEAEEQEDKVIGYTDITGIMMSSVRTIIDSVSYALIAFVAVSLVVSSIMIGIITYISVMERTKEIGVLRAIGASKRNISQVFNAETFIIGLCSGLIGIGVTLLLLIPGNALIQHLTDNPDIVAQLPALNGIVLIILSMVLTLIGGFIPARQAAKKDPVIALRSE
ncbi:MAG: ABC transporter ATP-binding protein/permease [Ruminococcaceae bacterium]|nr:ABC transporter ATP-binding protein/permease [Oscillospiraceae bacterium]